MNSKWYIWYFPLGDITLSRRKLEYIRDISTHLLLSRAAVILTKFSVLNEHKRTKNQMAHFQNLFIDYRIFSKKKRYLPTFYYSMNAHSVWIGIIFVYHIVSKVGSCFQRSYCFFLQYISTEIYCILQGYIWIFIYFKVQHMYLTIRSMATLQTGENINGRK